MSARRVGSCARRRSGRTSSAAPTRADLPLWARARGRGRRARCSSSAPAPGGVALHLAARGHRVVGARPRAEPLLAELAPRAREARGLEVETVVRRRPRVRARAQPFGADRSRRCSSSTCSAARPGAPRCSPRSRAHLAPGGRSPRRCSPTTPRWSPASRGDAAAARRARASTAGSTRACRSRSATSTAGSRCAGCARCVSPAGRARASEVDAIRLDALDRRRPRGRGRGRRAVARASGSRSPPPTTTSARSICVLEAGR